MVDDIQLLPAIIVESLSISLGSHVAVENVNFVIPQGSFTAVLGPNGSGKTTLLKAILGIVPVSSGSIRIFGKSLDDIRPALIGYIPQIKTLDRTFPATTCDLVASGMIQRWPARLASCAHEAVHEALGIVGAGHLIHRAVGKLSGGELQRVYLARALVRKPKLLVLDEPATGIDAVGEDDMNHILETYMISEQATIMMVTHDWLSAKHHATHALLINRRQIAFGETAITIVDENMRRTFGHIGHVHNYEAGSDV